MEDRIKDNCSLLLILERFVIRFELLFSDVDPKIFVKIEIPLKLVFSKTLNVQLGSIELNLNLNTDMSDTIFQKQSEKELRIIARVKTTDRNHDRVWKQIRNKNKFTEDIQEKIMNSTELVEIQNAQLALSEPTVDIIGNILVVLNVLYTSYIN